MADLPVPPTGPDMVGQLAILTRYAGGVDAGVLKGLFGFIEAGFGQYDVWFQLARGHIIAQDVLITQLRTDVTTLQARLTAAGIP